MLPTRLGGLGLPNPAETSEGQFEASTRLTAPLLALVVQQHTPVSEVRNEAEKTRKAIRSERPRQQAKATEQLRGHLSEKLQRCMDLAKKKVASLWLEALPIKEHQFNLSKGEFRDGLLLRYGRTPPRLPDGCVCGSTFNIPHALSCPTGGLPAIRHNEIRDLIAASMSEVCVDITTEPHLEPPEEQQAEEPGEGEHARLNISARGFWGGRHEMAFFDVRVFNPFASSAANISLTQLYRWQEAEKCRKYEVRVIAGNGSFTPLVFQHQEAAAHSPVHS